MESLFTALTRRAAIFPDMPAIISGGVSPKVLNNQQLLTDIELLASQLQRQNIQCLGLYMDNCADWIVIDLAASKLGITLVPIPLFFTAEQIAHLIETASIDHVITSNDALLMRFKYLVAYPFDAQHGLCGNVLLSLSVALEGDESPLLKEAAKVTFTSGSTGNPKGVCLSGQNIEAVCNSLCNAIQESGIRGGQTHLCVLPLATLLENIAGVYVCLQSGGVVVTEPVQALGFSSNVEFDASKLLDKFVEYHISSAILLPQILENLLQCDPELLQTGTKDLQFAAVGGGKVAPDVLQAAERANMPVFEGYGLSECGSVVCLNLPGSNQPGSVGKPLQHVRLSVSEQGEILVYGQSMLGYLGDTLSKPNVIVTGDLGHIDEHGYVHITGRIKNTLITSFGRNVSPEWVESELRAQPEIQQAAVFGDAQSQLCAVVVASDTGNSLQPVNLQAAIDRCNQNLPDYAQIGHWLVRSKPFSPDDDTLTHNGRIRRAQIEAMFKPKLNSQFNPIMQDCRQSA